MSYLLGAMVSILLARPEDPAEQEHHVRVALAPATPPRAFERFRERFGVQLVEGYGSTGDHLHDRRAPVRLPGAPASMGTARCELHVQVVDDQDEPVPDGGGAEG